MTEPRLSVVMPVFNGAVWLQKAINSVLQQSFSDFEFIIVDDASTDASKQIAMEAARNDSRIRRIDQRHMGVAAALNRGVALARSPWIARMDADDIANPARFQQQITFLSKHPDMAALGSWASVIDEEGYQIGVLKPACEPDRLRAVLVKQNPFIHASMMMSVKLVRQLGAYRTVLEGAEDYDLWLRISECAPLANLPECLISYRRHFSSVSATAAHKQLLMARLARLSAADRRASRPDFVDELIAPITLDTLRVHDRLRTTVEFYGTLARSSKNFVGVRDLNRLGCTDLNHAERKAAQYWLVSLFKAQTSWIVRAWSIRWLLSLHPLRGFLLAISLFKSP